jgi:hypothetical protein
MKTKLTLSIDKNLIQFAQRQARRKGTSISGMFSQFLMVQEEQAAQQAVPSVRAMIGALKGYNIDDSKLGVQAAYAKKHLR